MARIATKAAGNVFYQARIKAADNNERYFSREGAAGDLGMDSSRLAKIELGNINPNPDDIVMMAEMYRAPELYRTYCKSFCPLGREVTVPDTESLDRITVKAMAAARDLEKLEELLQITEDGKITEDEIPQLMQIMAVLSKAEQVRTNLQNYIYKHVGVGK